jgi:hypothetical protein
VRDSRGLVLVAVAALLVAALLVAGCGADKAPDPFVGTWSEPGDANPNPIIIAKVGDGYLVTIALPSTNVSLPATREGNTLSGTVGKDNLRFEVVYLSSGHLTFANSGTPDGPLNKPTEMTKTSDSTALPTPTKF